MSEKEYGTFGPAVDAERFFANPVYYEDGIDAVPSKEYSLYVSELMDRVGYNYEMIKCRQQYFAEYHEKKNSRYLAFTMITTGGRGEGTTLFYESDIDTMLILNDVICADSPQHFIHRENAMLFQNETQEAAPGYTRLKLLRFGGNVYKEEIRASLFEAEGGSYFISSNYFTEAIKRTTTEILPKYECTSKPRSGPSTPMTDRSLTYDYVVCFKCVCPNIIKRWMSRHRSHGWPSPETVHKVSLLDGHAVPVGSKGSPNMNREWRICYSLAELHLMRNLNEAQVKVYILLKKMCKTVLNPVCKDLTSYIMKNIILWVCEANGLDKFTRESIMDRLFDCIKYLKKCVDDNNLPSYMIPERNLLAGRLDIEQKQKLASVLSDLLKKGGRMFLRCEKLRDAMIMMYKSPKMLREYSAKRDKVESLLLIMTKITGEIRRPGMSYDEVKQVLSQHELYNNSLMHIDHLIQFDVQELLLVGKTPKEMNDLRYAALVQILS